MSSHIRLGTTAATLREYMLTDYRQYLRSNANQLAAKIGTGAGDYSDLQSWTAFAMDNWQAGVGKKDVDAGGFLYADSETRWPNRLQLPMALVPATQADTTNYPLNTGYCPGILKAESSVAIGSTQTVRKLAKRIEGNGTRIIGVHLYLANDDNLSATPITTTINVGLWTDSASLPSASLVTNVEYLNNTWGYSCHYIEFDALLSDGTFYWIVVEPTTALEIMNLPVDVSSVDPTVDGMAWYNGSAWASYTSGRMLIEPVMGMPLATEQINKLIYFPASGFMYAAAGETLYKQQDDASKWVTVAAAFAADITDLHTDGSTLYIGIGDSTNYKTMNGAETLTTAATPARIFTRWNGYLWRAVNNTISYTSDGVTWSTAVEVCASGFSVNGLSGQGDYMFVSCDDGLYYIGFGDSVFTVTPWGQLDPSEDFGKGMLNWQGALYIPLNAGIYRYDASSMLPVGPDLGEGLPLNRSGVIGAIATQNNWLYCLVRATAGASTVWAYNGQGWHYVTEAPTNDELYFTSIHYRRTNQKIYLGTNKGVIFTCVATDNPNAIDLDTLAYTTPYGTIETDWIYGGLRDVRKDWESVMIMGDGIDSLHPVRVYWLDEQSTEWEYLGEVTASGTELRWSDYATRPNSKQLCIGLGLYAKETVNYQGTPLIRGVRVKYHNMITDTFRWNLPIQISDEQMTNTTLATYTAVQMRTHLDTLVRQVPPVIFQDIDGVQYECKVLDCTVQLDKMEAVNDVQRYSAVYRITVEQVAYAAST
jgi:hypothetical protein